MAKKISSQKLSIEQAMSLAVEEGRKGIPTSSPNPSVGCVILDRNYKFLSSGFHAKAGSGHAEVQALKKVQIKSKLKGAHVVVTLEPCAHFGRTPPCAEALAKLPIASVTYGLKDPNPLVSGKGHAILKKAGIQVAEAKFLKKELEALHEVFLFNQRTQKSFFAVKVASSLDGQMAMANGESQWITSEGSRNLVQELRSTYDGILVGQGTLRADNPSLNIRTGKHKYKNQIAVIFDPKGVAFQQKKTYKFFGLFGAERTIWLIGRNQKHLQIENWDRVIFFDSVGSSICNWDQVQTELLKAGVASVLVEGGARTLSDIFLSRAVQRLFVFFAPKIIGAANGLSWTKDLRLDSLANSLQFEFSDYKSIGSDRLLSSKGFTGSGS